MKTRSERVLALKSHLKNRILVMDGATGTALQDKNLTAADFGGEEYEGCNEYLILTRPHIIRDVHEAYLEAGADIIETNTFGGTPLVLQEYRIGHLAYEINKKGAAIAREAADLFTQKNPRQPRFVAGSIGPTTKAITVTGGVTFDELIENFFEQARGLYDGGVDYFLLETCQDTRNIKAGLIAINKLLADKKEKIPAAVSGTIEPMGTMLGGQSVEALVTSLEHIDLLYVGLNCATGPEFMTDHIRSMSAMSTAMVACVPNAGLPDEDGHYLETPEMVSSILARFIDKGWINIVGGCCGTHAGHIRELKKMVENKRPRTAQEQTISRLSGVDILEITDEVRPILVGERTNVIGSKKFKKLIAEEKFDEASEIAKAQVKTGAHIIDICLANPDRNEYDDMKRFLELVIKKVRVPLMIDSTDDQVIELALTYSQGKAIINSINLEDGEERFHKVVPLAKKYGAALVVGTIDEDPQQGMAVTRKRKLEVATRSFDLLTKKYGILPQDIYFDPLVFPCATGDQNYLGSAEETIEGIRLIKEAFPLCKTVLGTSNVSFGLPEAGREVLNSVFMYLCTQAGLDLSIVNTEKIKRYSSLSAQEIELAMNLLYNKGEDPVAKFAAFFRGKKVSTEKKEELPLMQRLPRYILEGSKDGLYADLDEALKKMAPMEIINGPLMEGMQTVGKLFNENKLIVAEVLQSAESMKAAVAHLEPFMEKKQAMAKKGKIVLATVKGDVHDIGKNLVDIVLTNNGFEVVNLGIKIPSEQLIAAVKEHAPDILGLSGLLVKSAQQMSVSAEDLSRAGVKVPMMVGGAALSRNFVNKRIAGVYEGTVVYAKDAMDGLELANRITNPGEFEKLKTQLLEERSKQLGEMEGQKKEKILRTERSRLIALQSDPPAPSDLDRHVLKNTPIEVIFNYINPLMLYGRHLGIKGKLVRALAEEKIQEVREMEGGEKALEIYAQVEEVKKKYKHTHLKTKAVYQFFRAASEKNSVHIFSKDDFKKSSPLCTVNFARQDKEDGLCLADYVAPLSSSVQDYLGFFLVTVGEKVREESTRLKDAGDYLHSHILQALALESAEGHAEYLHMKMRSIWGLSDPVHLSKMDLFQARYHGKRYSFGYPACPRLDDQELLFKLLNPTPDIGVMLTDGFMMDPEASVSALVFHHPQASYFSVGGRDDGLSVPEES